MNADLSLILLAAVACGLMIGIERGWRQRTMPDGARVAGVRTFTLVGGAGGLIAVIGTLLSTLLATVLAAGAMVLLVTAFRRSAADRQDATTMVAAMITLLLGLLAGAGRADLALGGAALTTLVLTSREQAHRLLRSITPVELEAFALFAALSVAVLPFLPNRDLGPYAAWNPFKLWLVVILIIAFSVAGYIANRLFGERRGTIATAVIGGAYSSTAVTASLSTQLGHGQAGPLATGIALASAVMYIRVLVLAAVLAPVVATDLAFILGPATLTAWIAAAVLFRNDSAARAGAAVAPGKPFRVLPALGFASVVAGAALLVRWAQADFGEAGGAWSLFFAGSFDVDAAIVTYATLPRGAIAPLLAAFALAGTVAVNMSFKTGVLLANAGFHKSRQPAMALAASLMVLLFTLGWTASRLTT